MTGLRWHGDHVLQVIHAKAERAARRGAAELLDMSNDLVPDDPSTNGSDLRNSGKVTSEGTTSAVAYTSGYALYQHEALSWEHRPGQQAKFLEVSMAAGRGPILGVIYQEMRI